MKSCFSMISLFAILFFPLAVFGDGGTLSLKILPPEDNSTVWASEMEMSVITLPQFGKTKIGEEFFTGYRLNYNSFSTTLFLTDTSPFRLFSDASGDGIFGVTEELTGKPEQSLNTFTVRDEWIFYDANLSFVLGTVTIPFVADIRVWREKIGYQYQILVKIMRCRTVFEGILSANGQEFPARLFFLDLDFTPKITYTPKTYIMIDANRDGLFNPIDDPWFASDKTAAFDGSLWTVKTDFTSNAAFVSLTPYSGATGMLQLQGEGVSQVVLGRHVSGKDLLPEFSIPRSDNLTYTLPVGIYAIMRIWLRSKEQPSVAYQWPDDRNIWEISYPDLQISADETATAYVGAPLTDMLKMTAQNIYGNSWIEYSGSVNQRHYAFTEIKPDDLLRGIALQQAIWIVKDKLNRVIDSGQFRGEKAFVRLPFWGWGTYRIERLGSDNELIQRISLEITYHCKQPFIWGLLLILWIGLSFLLLHIDRAYSRSKLWALAPGILGLIVILVMEYGAAPYKGFFQLLGVGPLVLTFILLACRFISPHRIAGIFFTAILVSLTILCAINTFIHTTNTFILAALSLLFAFMYSAFYQTIRGRTTHKRILGGFFMALGIPSFLLIALKKYTGDAAPVWVYLAFLCPFAGFLCVLTLKVPWVRDRFALRLRDSSEMEFVVDNDKPESVA